MEKKTKLQIPMASNLRKALEQKSEELGFSSANELARVVLHNLVQGKINLEFLGAKEYIPMVDAETEKRIAESLADYKAGRYETIDMSKPNAINNWLDELGA